MSYNRNHYMGWKVLNITTGEFLGIHKDYAYNYNVYNYSSYYTFPEDLIDTSKYCDILFKSYTDALNAYIKYSLASNIIYMPKNNYQILLIDKNNNVIKTKEIN